MSQNYIPQIIIQTKPYIIVSAKGVSNGLSNTFNDGADFGPDTLLNATSPNQYGPPYTQTSGIQEAMDYVWNNGGGRVYIKNGTYNLTGSIAPSPYNFPGVLGTTYNASQNLPPLEIVGESMDGVILQGQTLGLWLGQNTAGNYVYVQYLLLKNLTFKSTYPTPSSPEPNTYTVYFSYAGASNENIIIWKNVHVIGTQGTSGGFSDFLSATQKTIRIMDNVTWENVPGWNINLPSNNTSTIIAKNYKVIVGPGPGMIDNALATVSGTTSPNAYVDMDLIFDATNANNSAYSGSGWLAFQLGPNNPLANLYGKIKITAINTGNLAGSSTGYPVINGGVSFANIEINGFGNVGGIVITGSANGTGSSHNKYKIKINGTGNVTAYVGSGYGYNDYDIDVTLTSSINGALLAYSLPSGTTPLYDRIRIKFNSPNGSTYSQSLIHAYSGPASNVLVEEAYLPNWPSGTTALTYLGNGTSNRINWKKVTPYPNVFLNDNFGGSYYNGPFPNQSSTISANTVYQNSYFADVYVIVQVTMNQTSTASASASIQVGSSSTSLTVYEQVSEPAGLTSGQVKTLRALVPLGWYYEIATTNATINAVYIEPAS